MTSKNIIAIIPARSGSKRIPGKNVKLIAGKPLIAWSIEFAQGSNLFNKIVVSTDGEEIINVANQYENVEIHNRDESISKDDTPTIDSILPFLRECNPEDIVVLLQPTSPVRNKKDIEEGLKLLSLSDKFESVVSVSKVETSPFHTFLLGKDNYLSPVCDMKDVMKRSQDHPKFFQLNGSFYIISVGSLLSNMSFLNDRTGQVVLGKDLSIDIDEIEDFDRAEKVLMSRDN